MRFCFLTVYLIFFISALYPLPELLVVCTNYPPHIYEENGIIKGLRLELFDEIFKRMGYDYKVKIFFLGKICRNDKIWRC